MERLIEHFRLSAFLRSPTASSEGYLEQFVPSPEVIDNLRRLADMLEKIRYDIQAPIHISSGYRCERLNNDRQ